MKHIKTVYSEVAAKIVADYEKKAREQYELAVSSLLAAIENEARRVLTLNEDMDEFVMGMGSFFITYKDGSHVNDRDSCLRGIQRIILEWDGALRLTGHPMRFTARGKKITDW